MTDRLMHLLEYVMNMLVDILLLESYIKRMQALASLEIQLLSLLGEYVVFADADDAIDLDTYEVSG
ncbi:MAG: hypothetical protein ACI4AA_10000 [Lachnospiraceae bacterium]